MVHGENSPSVRKLVDLEHNPDTDTESATTQNHSMAAATVQDLPLNQKPLPAIPIHVKVNSNKLKILKIYSLTFLKLRPLFRSQIHHNFLRYVLILSLSNVRLKKIIQRHAVFNTVPDNYDIATVSFLHPTICFVY